MKKYESKKLCTYHKALNTPYGRHSTDIEVHITECVYCTWDKSKIGQKFRKAIMKMFFDK